MIDIRKLKELVRLMVSSGLTELDLRDSEEQVTLRRHSPSATPHVMVSPAASHASHGAGAATAMLAEEDAAAEAEEQSNLLKIESPMVGTFYAASDPDAPAFINPGSQVTPDTVVCIIEAMKIFNEIKAECSGTVRKVMVKNGEAVEFGQALFLVEPG